MKMKMKMKLSMLGGALALAMAGQAGAVPLSDLYLTVVDTSSNTLYTRDLGVTVGSDISGTNSATLAAASLGNQLFAADVNMSSFLSAAGSDSLVWNVTAAFTGSQNFDLTGFVATSTGPSIPSTQQNATINNAAGNLLNYYTAAAGYYANGLHSGSTSSSPTVIGSDTSGNGYIKFTTLAGIGSSMDMLYLTPSSTGSLAKAASTVFGGAATADIWTLGSNGNLSVAAVAAVPEASEWMLMLSGFGLIGFIASRRKNSGGALTFA